MKRKLTRRRFGQLAIATTATAGLSYFANKTLAQTPSLSLDGIQPGTPTSADTSATNVGIAALDTDAATQTPSNSRQLVMQSLNLGTTQVQNLSTRSAQSGASSTIQFGEEITGFTYLADGTQIAAITPARTSSRSNSVTRLKFMGTSRLDLTISGLSPQQRLESLLGTRDGRLLGLVANKNGTPPFRLVDINTTTGNFTVRLNLPGNQRFSNLAECSDGRLYTTSVDNNGATSLVQLNLGQGGPTNTVQLRLNDFVWNNGIASLVCTSANQLLAFGALRYVQPNSVYTVDPSSGAMTKLSDFDVTKVTARPT